MAISRYEDRATQQAILDGHGQMALDSGRFRHLVTSTVETSLTYRLTTIYPCSARIPLLSSLITAGEMTCLLA